MRFVRFLVIIERGFGYMVIVNLVVFGVVVFKFMVWVVLVVSVLLVSKSCGKFKGCIFIFCTNLFLRLLVLVENIIVFLLCLLVIFIG